MTAPRVISFPPALSDFAETLDVGYDLILCAGQSNMAGRGTPIDTARIDVSNPRIWQYGNSGSYANMISLATEPLAMHNVPNGMGPALTFARRYVQAIPVSRQVLLVPVAHDSSAFSNSALCWKTDGSGTVNLYLNALAQTNAALAAAGPGSRVVGILWLQGENDAGSTGTYAAQLDLLIDGFRSAIPGAAESWFVLGQMLPDNTADTVGHPGTAAINVIHVDTPRRKLRCAYAPGIGGQDQGDGLHYNAVGQRFMGASMFTALAVAKANVLGVAPVAPAPPTLAQSGTSVTATWAYPQCRATNYAVRYSVNGGTAWTTPTRTLNLSNTQVIAGLTVGNTLLVQLATTNEQGTSAWSASSSLTLATVPGQVVGLTAGTATSSAQPLTWTATSGATSYLVEYKAAAAGTWLTFGTVTTNSVTVTGLPVSTSHNYRVTAINLAGSGTVSSTVTNSTTAAVLLLTEVGVSAYRAIGLRKMVTGATQSVLVRRSSDNTTQAIGFTGDDLDTASLTTFVGANDGFVVTWYDQSGNGFDVTQATTTKQAKLVTAGVLNTENGFPVAVFASSLYVDSVNVGLYAAGSCTVAAVFRSGGSSIYPSAISEQGAADTGNANRYSLIGSVANTASNYMHYYDSAGSQFAASTFPGFFTDEFNQVSLIDTGSQGFAKVNGIPAGATGNYVRSGHTMSLTRFCLGGAGNQFYQPMRFSEAAIWATALTETQRGLADANQKNYYGTP